MIRSKILASRISKDDFYEMYKYDNEFRKMVKDIIEEVDGKEGYLVEDVLKEIERKVGIFGYYLHDNKDIEILFSPGDKFEVYSERYYMPDDIFQLVDCFESIYDDLKDDTYKDIAANDDFIMPLKGKKVDFNEKIDAAKTLKGSIKRAYEIAKSFL